MTRMIPASLFAAVPLTLLCGLAAATLAGMAATSAAHAADHDDHDRGHRQVHREFHPNERSREARRYDDDDRRPDVYYSAPPIVYQPPIAYQQPGASLNFIFPFYR